MLLTNNTNRTNGLSRLSLSGNGQLATLGLGQEAWEWTKLRRIGRRQMDKFISLLPGALREGSLEAVNELRVTSRRLEQILELTYPKPRPRHIKKIRRRLKDCRHILGELRNCDALVRMADEAIAGDAGENVQIWEILKQYLEERRQHELPEALERFSRINVTLSYVRLKQDLNREDLFRRTAKNGATAKINRDGGKEMLVRRIIKILERRWHDFETAVEKSRRDPREETIHRMRIAAKRLRYLAEAMDKLHLDGSSELATWLKSLQQLVGHWHDRELMEHGIRDMLAGRKFRHDHSALAPEAQKLVLANHEAKEALERKFSWMTGHSLQYKSTKEWVTRMLANNKGNSKAVMH